MAKQHPPAAPAPGADQAPAATPGEAETAVHPALPPAVAVPSKSARAVAKEEGKADALVAKKGDRVMATKEGTYPEVGSSYGRFRDPGTVFTLNDGADFSPEWMRLLRAGDAALLPPPPPKIPQTTAPTVTPANPFPPLH